MMNKDFTNITAEELKKYMVEHDEKNYSLIDVRQVHEYQSSHIPGSRLITLSDLVQKTVPLPDTPDLIFICHSGRRSKTAAVFACESVTREQNIFNLEGGITRWYGRRIAGYPKVQLLGSKDDFDEIILAAIDMEKGAWNYYKTILEKFPDEPFKNAMEYLSLAEADHAETMYRLLEQRKSDPYDTPLPGFDDLFYGMKGDILEGGLSLADAVKQLEAIDKDRAVNILELSLDIEFAAFDLYKNAAQMTDDPEIKKILNGIANGEKNHMKKLAEAFVTLGD